MDIQLRPWTFEDLDNLVVYANNENIANNLTDMFPNPYTEIRGRSFIKIANSHNPAHILAITLNGEAIGSVALYLQPDIFIKNAEIGYWLGEPFWGKGITTHAVIQMVAYSFKNFNINRIYARPFGSNIASQKVVEKAGFTLEARFKNTIYKNGTYHDELVYGIRK